MCSVLSSFLYVDLLSIVLAAKDMRKTWLDTLETAAGMSRARVLACIVAPRRWSHPTSMVVCTRPMAALDAELLWWA